MTKGYLHTAYISIMLLCCSCSQSSFHNLVGNAKDKHGCLVSAGYQWSKIKNDCIRIWETGEKFTSAEETLYIVFSDDNKYAEIFTKEKGNLICKKKNNIWISKKGDAYINTVGDDKTLYYNGIVYRQTK